MTVNTNPAYTTNAAFWNAKRKKVACLHEPHPGLCDAALSGIEEVRDA